MSALLSYYCLECRSNLEIVLSLRDLIEVQFSASLKNRILLYSSFAIMILAHYHYYKPLLDVSYTQSFLLRNNVIDKCEHKPLTIPTTQAIHSTREQNKNHNAHKNGTKKGIK